MQVTLQTFNQFLVSREITHLICFLGFFKQIIDIEHDPSAGDSLEYDAEWIAVLKATNSLVNVTQTSWNMPEKNGLHAK